jgi:rhodanese-related sulfurtransferase
MKKLIGLAFCTAFLVAGCNETPKQEAATVEKKAPAAVAAVAPATPAQSVEAAPAAEAPKATITDIDWNKALEMSKAGAMLIDVRTPAEVAEGMAPGAINIPLQEIEQRLSEFPKDKDLLIYCRSGKRSMAASNFLIENGYDKVFNVVGGFLAFPKQ